MFKRICEKCNDQSNHSEPWKCGECKNKKSDKTLYVEACFKFHRLHESLEKANDELKHDKEKILRLEKEMERLTNEIANLKTKMQSKEEKIQHAKKEYERFKSDSFSAFKKLKK